MALRQLVTDPDSFMERRIQGRHLRWELVLLLVIGGLGTPGTALVAQSFLQQAGQGGEMLRFELIGFVIEPIIGVFLVWLGFAVGAHLVAAYAFNGRGPIKRLLKGTAWALVPLAVGNLARTAAVYLAFRDESFTDDPGTGTIVDRFQSVQESALAEPAITVGVLVLVVAVLYSGYLLSYAVRHAKRIPLDDARKAAAVPVGVFVLYLLAGLL